MAIRSRHHIRGGLDGAARARATVDQVLGEQLRLAPGLGQDLRLLVSELATNSLLHGGVREHDEFTLEIEAGEVIRITVSDHGDGFDPERTRRRAPAIGGYGLKLVERIADRWGVTRTSRATSVWFELDPRG